MITNMLSKLKKTVAPMIAGLLLLVSHSFAYSGYSYMVTPQHTAIYDYYWSSDQAKLACFSFAQGFGYDPSLYCHQGYISLDYTPLWEAGWLLTPIGPVTQNSMFYLGDFYYRGNRYYIELPPEDPDLGGPSCKVNNKFVGNPVNAKSGNKYIVENIVMNPKAGMGGISFSHYYNSYSTDSFGSLGVNWRHTYNRVIQQIKERPAAYPPLSTVIHSAEYTTMAAACTSGWDQVKTTISEPWVQNAIASLTTDNRCSITSAGTVWKRLPIRAIVSSSPGSGTITSSYTSDIQNVRQSLIRHDGDVVEFRMLNGVWVNEANEAEKLEESMDAQGVAIGWRHINPETDEVEKYDASGKLLSITNRAGVTQTLNYDEQSRLQQVSDSFGSTLTFIYNGQSRIQTMTDSSGGIYTYSYEAAGNLKSVTFSDGKMRSYVYENASFPHALTGIVDENGNRFSSYTYDSKGRGLTTEHAGGVERESLVYNSDGSTTITNALGSVRTYTFQTINGLAKNIGLTQACSSCGGSNKSTTYDTNGNPDIITDFNGAITDYDYDYDLTRNLETRRIEAKGTPQQRTITTQWHPTYRLPMGIAEPLKLTTYTRDARGNVLTKTEQATTDANGSQGLAATVVGAPRTWSHTYNSFGQVLTLDGPRTDLNDTTTYVYDPVNGNLQTITNALNHVMQISHHDASGRPLRLVDANGLVTQISYTARGWTDIIKVGTDTVYETTDLDYDGVGQLIKATLADGTTLSYSYDAAHRLTGIQDTQGNTIHYTLDLMGNRTATAIKDPSGTLKRSQRSVYTTLNQLSHQLGADKGADTQTTYYDEYDANGNLKKMRDAQGNTTRYSYDPFNRLATTLDALNGTTSYSYDNQGNLKSVTDPRGNSTSYLYDGLGNLTQLNSPDTGTTHYSAYDPAGNLLTQTDANGQTSQYQYDALNRLSRISYADNSTTVYSYDQGNNSIGRLSAVTSSDTVTNTGSTIAYQYDRHGRITRKTDSRTASGTNTNISLSSSYRYNSAGQLDQTTYPSGDLIGYSYSNGKLSAISRNGQPLLSNISVDPFGPVTGWRWGNSTAGVNRNYDLDGQLTSYTLANTTQQLNYATTGNLTTIADIGNPANNQNYGYDPLNRLTSASGPLGSQGYSYDANGNRLSATANINGNSSNNSYTQATNTNRLQAITGPNAKTYSYDANGNTRSDGLHNYHYNAQNRLISVDNTIHYRHNGLGQRSQKTGPTINTGNSNVGDANGDGTINTQDYSAILNQILGTPASHNADCNQDGQVNVQDLVCINIKINPSLQTSASTTHFAYDEQGQLIGEYDQNGAAIQETIYLGNLPVAVIKQGNVYRLYADHLNTPRAITDTTNKVVWRWQSDAFGTTAANEDVDGDGTRFSYNLRFPGQYLDQETGLHYNYFRDYNPHTGRYVQSDPIGLKGGLNTYAYVSSNPVSSYDPEGLVKISIFSPKDFVGWPTKKIPDKKGICIVMGHGSSESMQDDRNGQKNRSRLSPGDLNLLINKMGCDEEMPVELIACNTASGDNSFAEELAKIRGRPVTGANSYIRIHPNGQVEPVVRLPFIPFIPTGISGSWITYGK